MQEERNLIHLNDRALQRRARALHAAASAQPMDAASRALLLFYAAECGLKCLYMRRNRLRDTGETNAAAPRAASGFNHRLDDLIVVLRIGRDLLAPRPAAVTLRGGHVIAVDELHQAWRYGALLHPEEPVLTWLGQVVDYVIGELN